MDEIQYAFMSENGNYGFNFDTKDISTHFIITAILVKGPDKEYVEQEIREILQKYLPGEGNFSSLKDNHFLRMQILHDLKDLPFHIYSFVIDKRKIREDSGITFKKTFLKFFIKKVYEDLRRTFDRLDLVIDDDGSKEFMQQFKSFVLTESIPDLFNYASFGFNNSQSDTLLQLADLIAGTIAMGHDRPQLSDHYSSFYKIIKNRIIGLNLWPHDYRNFLYDYKFDKPGSRHDEVIIKQAVNLAYQYVEKHRKSDEDEERIRIDFLKFLLFNLKENPAEYVYTQEILDNLNALRDLKINQHYFRSNIVSKLRDAGLLIASSNKGYKLPACLNDLYDFVNLSSLTIHPMIQRISKCRDQILLATNNEIDILEQKEYDYLKRVIEMEKLEI